MWHLQQVCYTSWIVVLETFDCKGYTSSNLDVKRLTRHFWYVMYMNIKAKFISYFNKSLIRDSLMVRMGACRVPDRGSIPRRGDFFLQFFNFSSLYFVGKSECYGKQ